MHQIKIIEVWLSFFVVDNSFEMRFKVQLFDYVSAEVKERINSFIKGNLKESYPNLRTVDAHLHLSLGTNYWNSQVRYV